jgi:hypothetical protein
MATTTTGVARPHGEPCGGTTNRRRSSVIDMRDVRRPAPMTNEQAVRDNLRHESVVDDHQRVEEQTRERGTMRPTITSQIFRVLGNPRSHDGMENALPMKIR